MPTYIDYLEAIASLFFPDDHPAPTPHTNPANAPTTTAYISPTTKRTAAFHLSHLTILTCWLIPPPFQINLLWLSIVLSFIRALAIIKAIVALAAAVYAFNTTHFFPNDQEVPLPHPYSTKPVNELNLPCFEHFLKDLRATPPAVSLKDKTKDDPEEEDRMCIVCWETLSDPTWPTLPCTHLVCSNCLPRLAQATKQGNYCTCPYCSRPLFLGNTTTTPTNPTEEDDDEVSDEDQDQDQDQEEDQHEHEHEHEEENEEEDLHPPTPPSPQGHGAGSIIRRSDRFAQLGLRVLFDSGAVWVARRVLPAGCVLVELAGVGEGVLGVGEVVIVEWEDEEDEWAGLGWVRKEWGVEFWGCWVLVVVGGLGGVGLGVWGCWWQVM